jgi:hypothetical protein
VARSEAKGGVLPFDPMRSWGRALVAFGLVAIASAGCSNSTPPRLAQLTAFVLGEGNISVTYALTGSYAVWLAQAPDPDCDAGVCVETLDEGGGTTYMPGSIVGLTAQPARGWQFVSLKTTVWGQGGPADHSSVTITSTEPLMIVGNAGQQMYVYASFEPADSGAGPDAGVGTGDAGAED